MMNETQRKFRFETPTALIGIMENELIKSNENINDFVSVPNNGYGLFTANWGCYHAYISSNIWPAADRSFIYRTQFSFQHNMPFTISMELDMTQTTNEKAVLKYISHNKMWNDIKEPRTDGKYTNIAWDNIDISKEYRLVCLFGNRLTDGLSCWNNTIPHTMNL